MLGKGFFDDASRLGAGARGVLSSLAGEVERMVKTLLESRLRKLRLVSREEFEAVKVLAENARNEMQGLKERLYEIEKKQEGMTQEGMTKEGMTKEGMTKEGMTKEGITKEGMSKESVKSRKLKSDK